MIISKARNIFYNKKLWGHVVYWIIIYFYDVSSDWAFEDDKLDLIQKYLIKTSLLILLSYCIIYILIPYLLNKNKIKAFFLSGIAAIYLTYVIYAALRFYFFDIKFPEIFQQEYFIKRVTDLSIFFYEIDWFIFPTVLLAALQYYTDQKEVLTLKEQKKTSELNALKSQLNPHFLFNTLNNLYALSQQKSDQAPEVIMKLSKILDYMLYHCKENYVPLTGEINLLNDYIDLEKVRYGDRLEINFDYKSAKGIKIAPLLFVTFLENAFKHGVKDEIEKAKINLKLEATKRSITFNIENSIPVHTKKKVYNSESIGLINVKKQLNLLYPEKHTLTTKRMEDQYVVNLKLNIDEL